MPIHELWARTSELETHRGDLVIVVSRAGLRARLGAEVLRCAGFGETLVLAGGMDRWRALGFPIEHSSRRFAAAR